jgi:hypothetical protein
MRERRVPTWKATVAVLIALICDAVIGFGGAELLWATGTATVATAPTSTFVIVIIGTALLVVCRHGILGQGALRRATRNGVLVGDLLLAGAIALAWQISGDYFLGWVTSYVALLLLVTGIFELFGAAAGQSRDSKSGLAWSDFIRFFVLLAGVGGLVATSDIHGWNLAIINTVLLTAACGIGLGILGRFILFRSTRRGQPTDVIERPVTRAGQPALLSGGRGDEAKR